MKQFTPDEIINATIQVGGFTDLLPETTDKFYDWLQQNYHVVQKFYEAAHLLKSKGKRKYYSMYCIREKLRWDSMVSEVGTKFKLSNNFTPHLARLVMELDPHLNGMFKLKSTV
jgi:hypothetical protein